MIALFWIIIIFFYVKLAFWTARFLSRRAQKIKTQNIIKLSVALIFILIPTWDVILGRLYFNYLCDTEGGIRMYKQAELPLKHWKQNGVPRDRLVKTPGGGYQIVIGDRFILERHTIKNYALPFKIEKEHKKLRNKITGELLSEFILFRYWGGWLINNTGLNRSAENCSDVKTTMLYKKSFIKGS